MKKVAICARDFRKKTGMGMIIYEHIKYFKQNGIDVTMIAEKMDEEELDLLGVKRIKLFKFPFGKYLSRYVFAKKAQRLIQKKSFDLVIGHGDTFEQDVLFMHNMVEKAYEMIHGKSMQKLTPVARIHRKIFETKRFRLIIANSELMKSDLVERFGIDANRIQVVYPGYDPDRFSVLDDVMQKNKTRQMLGVEEDELLIAMITSGNFKKRGLDIVVEALNLLDAKNRRFKFLVVGKDKSISDYQQKAAAYGFEGKFLHRLPIADIEKYFQVIDIFVHPAYFEEFGLVVQEAMASGKPVLTSACVGASELIKGSDRTILMDQPSAADLADKLSILISSPEERIRWSEISRRSVAASSWSANIDQTITAINTVMDEKF